MTQKNTTTNAPVAKQAGLSRKQRETITKAFQCAQLLVSDIREAHKAACKDNDTSRLLEMLLLPLITESATIAGVLHQLETL